MSQGEYRACHGGYQLWTRSSPTSAEQVLFRRRLFGVILC